MHVLRQLPFRDAPYTIEVAGEQIIIRGYKIVVWVSLGVRDVPDKDAPRFPAVLDTGHSHNFSIRENQLLLWTGIRPDTLQSLGTIVVNREEVPLRAAHLWIHRNRPGTAELLARPFHLEVLQGVAVYPSGVAGAPRLPLLGLRGLVRNKLRVTIDGDKMSVSLRT